MARTDRENRQEESVTFVADFDIMSNRVPLQAEFQSAEHVLFARGAPSPDSDKIRFRHCLESLRAPLSKVFDAFNETYSMGAAAQAEWNAKLDEIKKRPDMMWTDADIPAMDASAAALAAAQAIDVLAGSILLPFDALLTSVRRAMNNSDIVHDDGPILRAGISVDRALDAAGNYFRHRHEWADAMREHRFTNLQMNSIRPLSRVLTNDATLDGDAAYEAIVATPHRMVTMLDLLSGYEELGEGSLAKVEAAIFAAASATIDRHYAAVAAAKKAR